MAGSLVQGRRCHKKQPKEACFPSRTNLFDPAHPSDRMYLLQSGRVRLSSDQEAIVDHLAAGDFFGEKCLLTPRRKGQSAKTLSPIKVTVFRKRELLDRLQHDRHFALHLLKTLALRIDRYEQTLRDFVKEPAERRLARQLSRLVGRSAADWVRLPFGLTNAELAKMVGTTRWRISYFLNHFQKLGWLRRQKDRWTIHREGLREFLERCSQR